MKAYSNGVSKAAFLAELRRHREADRFVQGDYWQEDTGRGCAVGCGIASLRRLTGRKIAYDNHGALARVLGLPEALIAFQDYIFEGLAVSKAVDWPIRFAAAIETDADLSGVPRKFIGRTLRELILPFYDPLFTISLEATQRAITAIECGWTNGETPSSLMLVLNVATREDPGFWPVAGLIADIMTFGHQGSLFRNVLGATVACVNTSDSAHLVWSRVADCLIDEMRAVKAPAVEPEHPLAILAERNYMLVSA